MTIKTGISQYIWHAEGSQSCEACQSLHGKTFKDAEDIPFIPVHPNCKCWLEPIYDEELSDPEVDTKVILEEAEKLRNDIRETLQELSNILKITTEETYKRTAQAILNEMETWDNAVGDFARNYENMKEANTEGADKYYHAKANAQATQRGLGGFLVAHILSAYREIEEGARKSIIDGKNISDIIKDAQEDLHANEYGRKQGLKHPNTDAGKLVKKYRPKDLDKKHW